MTPSSSPAALLSELSWMFFDSLASRGSEWSPGLRLFVSQFCQSKICPGSFSFSL